MTLIEFTTPTCASCKEQKKILDKFGSAHKDIKVEIIDLFSTPSAQALFAQCYSSTFPTLAVLDQSGTRIVYAEGGLHSMSQVESLVAKAKSMG